jgi:CheY-like chemotaxis protein
VVVGDVAVPDTASLVRLPIRRPRSLLVEDEYPALERRRDLLRLKDLDVIAATSEAEAYDRLRDINFRVDVVMTDLNLTAGSDTIEGVNVAQAVADHSGQSVPLYAYSGKRRFLAEDRQRLFKQVVLKSASSSRVREVFNSAAEDARQHFKGTVQLAETALSGASPEPRPLSRPQLILIRDLIAGAAPSTLPPSSIPDRVGFLPLTEHFVGVPYGIVSRKERPDRVYAMVIGHEYLLSYGANTDDAVSGLEDVVRGFAELVDLEDAESGFSDSENAVGPSRRMRKLFFALRAREEEALKA